MSITQPVDQSRAGVSRTTLLYTHVLPDEARIGRNSYLDYGLQSIGGPTGICGGFNDKEGSSRSTITLAKVHPQDQPTTEQHPEFVSKSQRAQILHTSSTTANQIDRHFRQLNSVFLCHFHDDLALTQLFPFPLQDSIIFDAKDISHEFKNHACMLRYLRRQGPHTSAESVYNC